MAFFSSSVKSGFLILTATTLSLSSAYAQSSPVKSLVINPPPPIVQEISVPVPPRPVQPEKPFEPKKVVVSFSILKDLVQSIGGSRVSVISLVDPEQDAHTYQTKPQDMKHVNKADLLVLNGRGFEGWMERLSSSSSFKGKKLTILSDDPQASADKEDHDHDNHEGHAHDKDDHSAHEHEHTQGDPHQWHDPVQLKAYVEKIQTALTELDPEGKEIYAQNADHWLKQMGEVYNPLKAYVDILKARYAHTHKDQKACHFVVMHEAFDSFGRSYGCILEAVQANAVEAEPSAKTVATLVRLSKENQNRPLFQEPVSSGKILEQIRKETGVQILTLYSDYLSQKGGKADTVLDMMKYNGEQLIKALESVQ